MIADVFTQRLPESAAIFMFGLGLICVTRLIRSLRKDLDLLSLRILQIQHGLNPLHVYCRLVDRGLDKKWSRSICKYYGIIVYSWLSWCSVVAVKVCNRSIG